MDVYPLEAGDGLLVMNTVFVDRPHTDDGAVRPPTEEQYTGPDGLVLQCSFCRRVRRADSSGRWDRVPAWVQDPPPNVTGGLCEPCLDLHFPAIRPRS